jgi:hypothetical protein
MRMTSTSRKHIYIIVTNKNNIKDFNKKILKYSVLYCEISQILSNVLLSMMYVIYKPSIFI